MNIKSRNKYFLKKYFLLFLIYFCGVCIALILWDKIKLPYSNPWNIIGVLTIIKFNPLNNIIRFLIFLILPSILLILFYFSKIKNKKYLFKNKTNRKQNINLRNNSNFSFLNRKIIFVLIILFTIIVALNIPTFHSERKFDPFHEGESLGPAMSYMEGCVPYKDIIFVHGIFQDPLRSVIAFNLFGRSIGASRTLESIMKILAYILLILFLIKLFNGNYLYTLVVFFVLILFMALWVLNLPPLTLIVSREVTTFSFLITLLFIYNLINNNKISKIKVIIISYLFSFIPLSSFVYSIDRGFYLFTTYIILFPIILYFLIKKKRSVITLIISSSLGLLSAFILIGILLKWNFLEFINFVFVILPKYKELMDGRIYPIKDIKFSAIICIMSFNMFWVIHKILKEIYFGQNLFQSVMIFFKKYFIEFSLLILSVFFFRSALGRSDWEHVIYSSSLIYILTIYIFIKYYFHNFLIRSYKFRKIFTYTLFISFILLTIIFIYRINRENLITENFPLTISDSEFIPDNYKKTIEFLKNNLNDEEYFFTMTSEGAWYYFIDKPCPTRFPVVWFALPPFYQEEIVKNLETNNVTFILYRNDSWANRIDGFKSHERLPIVNSYIINNYKFFRFIDDNELWIKKNISVPKIS